MITIVSSIILLIIYLSILFYTLYRYQIEQDRMQVLKESNRILHLENQNLRNSNVGSELGFDLKGLE